VLREFDVDMDIGGNSIALHPAGQIDLGLCDVRGLVEIPLRLTKSESLLNADAWQHLSKRLFGLQGGADPHWQHLPWVALLQGGSDGCAVRVDQLRHVPRLSAQAVHCVAARGQWWMVCAEACPLAHGMCRGVRTCAVAVSVLCCGSCCVLCCAVLCCAVLCCAVLCCAVLCCAVLCCAVLCCAVLCCAVPLQLVP
jgi:hypothetical protein